MLEQERRAYDDHLPEWLTRQSGKFVLIKGIDTGASVTCIDDAIAQQLALPVIDVVQRASASHAATQQNVYPAHLEVVGSNVHIEVPRAIGAALASQGIIALIGRDVLMQCTLHYNGPLGSFTLSI